MKLRLLLCLSAILLIFAASVPARAQTGANPPPTIIRFGADLPVITLEDAEAGETAAILSWRTVGMVGDYRLRLDAFQMHGWASLLAEGEPPLDAVGRLPIIVQHPLTFAPPTYRLQIVDAAGHVVDERIAVVPYDLESVTEPPAVESFTAGATSVDVNALARGEARIPVSWRAVNRPPAANLVFEQVLASGQSVSAELPRDTLWVASAGSGTVAPILPGSERTITLRLRLVDLENGETLAQQEISLSVTGTLATPTPLPTTPPPPTPVAARPTATFSPPPPPPANAPVIVSFTVTPNLVDRGGQVTVSWQVTGASDVTVWRLEPAGRLAESVGAQPLIGAWTLVLQNDYTDSAVFYLVATGANGARSEATATVLVRCPYTYFFGATRRAKAARSARRRT